ncbi:hypothetical protein ADS46_12585 [Halomonas sp. G11]|nr:hypothetical protein ADS46_12585 [Halomonas sp. G11]
MWLALFFLILPQMTYAFLHAALCLLGFAFGFGFAASGHLARRFFQFTDGLTGSPFRLVFFATCHDEHL